MPPGLARPKGPRMAPPFCGRSIRGRAHPFARGARAARSPSVPHATVVSPPRGGRCPRRTLAAAGSRAPCHAHSSSVEVVARRFAAEVCGRWALTHAERPAIRGEPQVRTFQCDTSLGAPLGSPPLGTTPSSFSATRRPRLGASAVSWRIAARKAGRVACAATGSSDATSGSCGPSAAPTTQPRTVRTLTEPSGRRSSCGRPRRRRRSSKRRP